MIQRLRLTTLCSLARIGFTSCPSSQQGGKGSVLEALNTMDATIIKELKRLKHKIGRLVLPDSPSSSSVPLVEYYKWLRYTRFTPDYPHSIDIQTKSGCNAHCTFCPVGHEDNKI